MNLSEFDCNDQAENILNRLRGAKVGIVGGGWFCHKLLSYFFKTQDVAENPQILGVADIDDQAVGLRYAREKGIATTRDYRDLLAMPGVQVILEITRDKDLAALLQKTKPENIQLIDHFHARYLWEALEVEKMRLACLAEFQSCQNDPAAVQALIEQTFNCFNAIMGSRNARSRQIELELVEYQRTQAQIIQGSTIPTFVINREHLVTHWNKALEKMSGWPAEEMVGTNRQWAPFWDRERPTMADVIVDQIEETEIEKLYGSQWRKSPLIEGAYEAELLFPQMGQHGKWLWFTAAPIMAPDGTIAGAIETLWDKTEDKKAEEERERHTRELAALCSIYTALSAPWLIDYRIEAALKEVQLFLRADDVRIYLRNPQGDHVLRYHYGQPMAAAARMQPVVDRKFIRRIAESGEMVLIERLDAQRQPELAALAEHGCQSLAFIPISAKEKRAIGLLQIASRRARHFESGTRHLLDLIGNRIGVAVENATLQEQYIKSEEKYRSLFNNDPNPIFIVNHTTLEILDTNERAQEYYGYTREELLGTSFVHLGDADDQEMASALARLASGSSVLFPKKRHFTKAGRPFYVNINAGHAQYGERHVLIIATTDINEALEKETQLIQASKMTTLGLMAAGMAHEINQPLNVLQICADYFLKMLDKGTRIEDDDLRTMARDIISNVDRATGIIRHVRDFARQSEVHKRKMNLNHPIEDVFKVMGHQIKSHQIELTLDLDPGLPLIMADHNRLEQVFINLVNNAIDAMDEKAEQPRHKDMPKRLTIRTWAHDSSVLASVADNGIGMTDEVRGKIIEPFFTTKKIGKGTGLGVSISYGIIKDYEGNITIESQVDVGTTFTIAFPAVADG